MKRLYVSWQKDCFIFTPCIGVGRSMFFKYDLAFGFLFLVVKLHLGKRKNFRNGGAR